MKTALCSTLLAIACGIPMTLAGATVYTATLSGANEVPPVATPATGAITVTVDGSTLSVNETYSGLLAAVTGAHIHCCAATGVNAAIAIPFNTFPTGTSGTFSISYDLGLTGTYTAAFLTASGGTAALAQAALITGMNSGLAYANIHDSINPGGEIRGQLAATPEPAAFGLAGLGILSIVAAARRRRSS